MCACLWALCANVFVFVCVVSACINAHVCLWVHVPGFHALCLCLRAPVRVLVPEHSLTLVGMHAHLRMRVCVCGCLCTHVFPCILQRVCACVHSPPPQGLQPLETHASPLPPTASSPLCLGSQVRAHRGGSTERGDHSVLQSASVGSRAEVGVLPSLRRLACLSGPPTVPSCGHAVPAHSPSPDPRPPSPVPDP